MTALISTSAEQTGRQQWQPSKMSWWYDAIIDLMTANPQMTKKDIAASLNCTPAAIYLITNSDIFKARYSQRRAALTETLDGAIHQKLLAVADRSLGLIAEVLDKKRDQIPLPQLESLADKVLDRLGYGAKPVASQSPVVVNLNDNRSVVVPVSPSDLDAARAALRRAETAKILEAPEGRARQISLSVPEESRVSGGATDASQIQTIEGFADPFSVAGGPSALDGQVEE